MRLNNIKYPIIGVVVLLAAFAVWRSTRGGAAGSLFRTVAIQRGDFQVTISATGTIVPEEVVDVGAQVAGKIVSFGTDKDGRTIDYGSVVEEGTVLANIDDSLYSADVAQARALINQTKAHLVTAQSKFAQAERNWQRAEKLKEGSISQTDYENYLAVYETTKAEVLVAEANISQAEATLNKNVQNLQYCTIKSPVSGVIIDRRVNIGQTVVASLNAPSLFLIAKDLKRMQVWVAVNEADIGSITAGQHATFSVDAFPDQVFEAKVSKIRLNASMTQNVVTYTVELITDNSSGKLLPYLTANVRFEVAQRSAVLLVPNAALRWVPKAEYLKPDAKDTAVPAQGYGRLWFPEGAYVRPVNVKLGASDGSQTEIEGDDVQDGALVVIGEAQNDQEQAATAASPFAPQMMRGKGRAP